ncbi:MAG: sodium:alanine symporter family protein [Cyclobacteriaceae bacterium]|nr:sodium:alanine symporter family protein [Cyclobacteriaceae bacterium]
MQELNDFLNVINGYIGGHSWFVFALLGTGVFFTLYLGFPQIRFFKHALKIVRGKFDKKGDEGDATHFQALATALSGTVGTGNIGGVALAIHLGGPAALFWMLVTAFLGMTTKFVEVTLSHKYREKIDDGTMAGGPMYYMKNADIRLFGKKINLKWLAAIFAFSTILSSFGTGNMPQINNIATSMNATFGWEQWIIGAVLAVFLALVILGGIKRIVKVTEKLVPFMAIIYFVGALAVILFNYENIIPSFISIFADIFTGSAAVGGFLGANIAFAFNRGVNRGLFSNEAGQGSAPIAHAAAKAHEPVSEGMVAILEPFIDTIIICTLTGLVLLSSGVWNKKFENTFQNADLVVFNQVYEESNDADKDKLYLYLVGEEKGNLFTGDLHVEEGKVIDEITIIHARSFAENVMVYKEGEPFSGTVAFQDGKINQEGVDFKGESMIHSAALTTEAFKVGFFGDFGQYIVSIGLLLFAFSTAISWSYYGDRATTYLFGSKYVMIYRIIYVAGFFFASFADTTIIWTLSELTIALMTVPNLIGILLLRKEMKSTIKEYWISFKADWPNAKTPS